MFTRLLFVYGRIKLVDSPEVVKFIISPYPTLLLLTTFDFKTIKLMGSTVK